MQVGDPRAERLAMNEVLFRDVNQLILEEQAANEDDRTTFVCECAQLNCQLRLTVNLDEYQAVRAHPTRFLVYPGHEIKDIEVIVGGEPPRYLVIEKLGKGKDVANES
jgi:hypothetical protein